MIIIDVRYNTFPISTLWAQGSFAKMSLLATLGFFHFPFPFFSISGLNPTPEIELFFAFSATGTNSSVASALMKNTIAEIINTYGTLKLRYLAIVFGNQVQPVINVADESRDEKTLISLIRSIRQPSGSPRIDVALKEAKKIYLELPER